MLVVEGAFLGRTMASGETVLSAYRAPRIGWRSRNPESGDAG